MSHDFGPYIRCARERKGLTRLNLRRLCGLDDSYCKKIEEFGYIPSREVVETLAAALELPVGEALVRAGFVPQMDVDACETILLDLRSTQLRPELRAALRGLHGLPGSQLQEADAMLVGLARGFALAREQRRRAS